MSKGRLIYPEIWESKDFLALSTEAQLLWIGLFSTADDEGRGSGDPTRIKVRFFPLKPIGLAEIEKLVGEIAGRGMANFYEVEGSIYYEIPERKWKSWQPLRYVVKSRFPKFAENFRKFPPTSSSSSSSSLTPSSPPRGDGEGLEIFDGEPEAVAEARDAEALQAHMEYYNANVAPHLPGKPRIEKLTEDRKRKLRARLEDYPDLWERIVREAGFLGAFAWEKKFINFDFLMAPARLQKFLEGFYRKREVPRGPEEGARAVSRVGGTIEFGPGTIDGA